MPRTREHDAVGPLNCGQVGGNGDKRSANRATHFPFPNHENRSVTGSHRMTQPGSLHQLSPCHFVRRLLRPHPGDIRLAPCDALTTLRREDRRKSCPACRLSNGQQSPTPTRKQASAQWRGTIGPSTDQRFINQANRLQATRRRACQVLMTMQLHHGMHQHDV